MAPFCSHPADRGLILRSGDTRVARYSGDEVIGRDCSIVVTGDFNAAEASDPYQAHFQPVAEQASLVLDTFRVAHPEHCVSEGTFSGFRSDATGGTRIDWIGASRDWEIVEAAVDRTARDGRTPSDHFPVTARLRHK